MTYRYSHHITASILFVFCWLPVFSQLTITPHSNAQALAQRLVGDGVSISNVTFTGDRLMAGFFNNQGGNNILIDSGIVLTTGRAKTIDAFSAGVDGNGTTVATSITADNPWGRPGDADLANAIGQPPGDLNDACILEFDFVPLGDSIRFNYVFGSEEYTPDYVCNFNDAFAFFISGPGISGLKNIALLPNSTTPVSIFNVNNVPGGACPNNTSFYIINETNTVYTHDGHTVLLTAKERVQPCQTYHLKLVISDVSDDLLDSGVFIEARSLSSNSVKITNLTQVDPATSLSYLVEGCQTGAFEIRRPRKDPFPLNVALSYSGAAINGVDVQAMPANIVIPANDDVVVINVIPAIDGTPEGIEHLKIYALAGCAVGFPTDSALIQIRDYDILSLVPDTAYICRNSSVQLLASNGYTTYQWQANPGLSATNIPNPQATPINASTTYICTATLGTCNAQDSVFVRWKDMEFIAKQDVNCRNGNTGQIKVAGGGEWQQPVLFSIDGVNWQTDSVFNNLPVGSYWVKIKDAACMDSIQVNIIQAYPDLTITNAVTTSATCSGLPDGTVELMATGGLPTYQYSSDGINFQSSSVFNLISGNYTFTIKDANGCTTTTARTIPLNDTITVDAGLPLTICEGTGGTFTATSNAAGYSWSPSTALSNSSILTPVASPVTTTKYYLTATTGICIHSDSVVVNVNPAPVPDAGPDASYCFGKDYQLQGAGGATYTWSPVGDITSSPALQNPAAKARRNMVYSLMVVDALGCKSLVADNVSIQVTPAVKIFAGNDTIAAINQPIQLQVRELGNAGVNSYTWVSSQYLNNPAVNNPIAILPADTRYIVTGRTPDGCEGSDDILIKVYKGPEIYVPTAFTPDNNGLNDYLSPVLVGISKFHYMRIYNRWGQVVYTMQNPLPGWDGKISGTPQGTGTYVWVAEATDYKGNNITRKGTITLIR